jgi:uncharacterized membrane protein
MPMRRSVRSLATDQLYVFLLIPFLATLMLR